MIKDCRNEISQPLTYIINLSLKSGIVPSIWKHAKVTPIHKSGDTKKPENYRPISVLPIFSKILERALHTQLSQYLENNELLTEFQFGYRRNRSTKLASTLLCDNIRNSIDKENMVGAVYIDLTKAFDTVGHGILLNKLYEYGIEGNEQEWITNYLFNREQVVCVEGTYSTKQPLLSGVPQGSIPGPLLFILFFNDFPECFTNSRIVMYADDTVIYVTDKNKAKIEQHLEEDLEKIAVYFEKNELIINLKKGKTEAMIFGTGKRLSTTDNHLDVSYRGQSISNVPQYKYLGNIVDQYLNFNSNFDHVYKKASGRLKLLKRLRHYLTTDSAYYIFTMTVQPILTYRSTVKLLYTNTQQKRLKSLMNRAERIVGRKVPCIISAINKEACCLVKKSLDKTLCSSFNDYFEINNHSRKTRNSGYLLKLPKVKLELGKQSFAYAGAKIFNDLPLGIRKVESYSQFTIEIRKHFN